MDQLTQRVRLFAKELVRQVQECNVSCDPNVWVDNIPDEKLMELVGRIMNTCKLSFTTYIVEGGQSGIG